MADTAGACRKVWVTHRVQKPFGSKIRFTACCQTTFVAFVSQPAPMNSAHCPHTAAFSKLPTSPRLHHQSCTGMTNALCDSLFHSCSINLPRAQGRLPTRGARRLERRRLRRRAARALPLRQRQWIPACCRRCLCSLCTLPFTPAAAGELRRRLKRPWWAFFPARCPALHVGVKKPL